MTVPAGGQFGRGNHSFHSRHSPSHQLRRICSHIRGTSVCAARHQREVPPLEARSQQLLQMEPMSFPVRGVSFEGRQSVLLSASEGQGVAFLKEPANEYDPNAIRIELLSGQQLGYVPRDLTGLFPNTLTFGHIRSIGEAPGAGGMYGAFVAVRPELPSIIPELFPGNVSHPAGTRACDLTAYTSNAVCRKLRDQACLLSNGRCEFTGGTGNSFVEQWDRDESSRTIRLAGIKCAHGSIRMVKHLAFLKGATSTKTLDLLQKLNQWSPKECREFLETHALRQMEASTGKEWTIDLSWLASQSD